MSEQLRATAAWLASARPALMVIASAGAVVAGVWSLAGWQWAAIAVGTPGVAFYVWGQIRAVTGGTD